MIHALRPPQALRATTQNKVFCIIQGKINLNGYSRLVVFRASATLNYRARFAKILCKSNPYKILQCFVQFRYGYKVSGYYSIIKTFLPSHYFRLTVTGKADIMKEHRTGKPFQNRPKSESLSVFTRLFVDGDSMVT